MKDSHWRSITKGVSWRILGTMATVIISYIITGELPVAISIGGIEFITKVFLFYLHERIWGKINWGRVGKIH